MDKFIYSNLREQFKTCSKLIKLSANFGDLNVLLPPNGFELENLKLSTMVQPINNQSIIIITNLYLSR